MSTIFDAASAIQQVCRAQGWPFCFIGGVAVQRWAEPRATVDVDLTVLTGFGGERTVIEHLLDRFSARIDEAAEFAQRNRVLLLQTSDQIGVDVSLGALPYEERMVGRASDHEFILGQPLRTCSAEDLVVLKAFAGRHIDWADIERVVARVGSALDVDLIMSEVTVLLEAKEALGDLEFLRTVLGRQS